MQGELENLYRLFVDIADRRQLASIYPGELKDAIGEFLVHCPVYLFYASQLPFQEAEVAAIEEILNNTSKNGKASYAAISLLKKYLLEKRFNFLSNDIEFRS